MKSIPSKYMSTTILDYVVNMGSMNGLELHVLKTLRITNSLALITSASAAIVVILMVFLDIPYLGIFQMGAVAGVMFVPIFLNKMKMYIPARIAHIVIANIIVISLSIFYGLDSNFQYHFLVLAGLPLIMFSSEIGRYKWVLCCLTLPGWALVQTTGILYDPVLTLSPTVTLILSIVNIIFQLIFIGSMFYLFSNESESHVASLTLKQKQLKEMNSDLDIALEKSNEAAKSKSMFLANMSHEIRTPLNGIIVASELLGDTALSEDQKTTLSVVHESGHSLLRLINDILDFSKIEAQKLEFDYSDFNIVDFVERQVDQFKLKCGEKGLELISYLDPDIPQILVGDEQRIGQILMNLIGNAVKFCNEGQVYINVHKRSCTREGFARIEFNVEDTGIGIASEKIDTIFESFTQEDGSTSRNYGGTGLGTTISKTLVEMMGGQISAESPNKNNSINSNPGSVFSFYLELKLGSDKTAISSVKRSLIGKKCLLIDDNQTNLFVLSKVLEQWGTHVTCVDNGSDGIEMMAEYEPDIVLLDYHMPVMDGLAVATKMSNTKFNFPYQIIMLSSDGFLKLEENNQFGIFKCLVKPVRQEELHRTIEMALGLRESQEVLTAPKDQRIPGMEGKTILVAEDNVMNQFIAQQLFSSFGLEIDIANNGLEVLDKVADSSFDLIFMDYMMPELDGLEATRRLRALGCTIPIIAMTANAMKGDREICMESGMDDYLSKPIDKAELRSLIIKWGQHRN